MRAAPYTVASIISKAAAPYTAHYHESKPHLLIILPKHGNNVYELFLFCEFFNPVTTKRNFHSINICQI